jgi:hypothetical protein
MLRGSHWHHNPHSREGVVSVRVRYKLSVDLYKLLNNVTSCTVHRDLGV